MGSDLSIVACPCVPAPPNTLGRSNKGSLTYTELRLIDHRRLRQGTLPPSHLILHECTLDALASLDLCEVSSFRAIHDVLCCDACDWRIGLASDPSVRLGLRLYDTAQRYAFNQGFATFLTKLTDALTFMAGTERRMGGPGASLGKKPVAHQLFLVDLRHSLLDDASGPWLVRDLADLSGCVMHYHSAVSLLSSARHSVGGRSPLPQPPLSFSSSSWMYCGAVSPPSRRWSQERKELEEMEEDGLTLGTTRSWEETPLGRRCASLRRSEEPLGTSVMDSSRGVFCRSLCHVLLSQNNMSIVGLRKCLHSLLQLVHHSEAADGMAEFGEDAERLPLLLALESIDLRENEESMAVQRIVQSLSLGTSVHVLVGDSGMRWRHTERATGSFARPAVKLFYTPMYYDPLREESFTTGDGRESLTKLEDPTHLKEQSHKSLVSAATPPDPRPIGVKPNTEEEVKSTKGSTPPTKAPKAKKSNPTTKSIPRPAGGVSASVKKPPTRAGKRPLLPSSNTPPSSQQQTRFASQEETPVSSVHSNTGAARNASNAGTLKKAGTKKSRSAAKQTSPLRNESPQVVAPSGVLMDSQTPMEPSVVCADPPRQPPSAPAKNLSPKPRPVDSNTRQIPHVTIPHLPIPASECRALLNETVTPQSTMDRLNDATPHGRLAHEEAEALEGDIPAAFSPSPRQPPPPPRMVNSPRVPRSVAERQHRTQANALMKRCTNGKGGGERGGEAPSGNTSPDTPERKGSASSGVETGAAREKQKTHSPLRLHNKLRRSRRTVE